MRATQKKKKEIQAQAFHQRKNKNPQEHKRSA
jgi:hypothetical protein